MSFASFCVSFLLLLGCTRADTPKVVPPVEPSPVPAPSPAAAAPEFDAGRDAGRDLAFSGAPDADDWYDLAEVRASPESFCIEYFRDIAKVYTVGSHKHPACKIQAPPEAFHAAGVFLEAKTMHTDYAFREESSLLLRTAEGWRTTHISWNVTDEESATIPWHTLEPDRIEVRGARLLAYAAGDDVTWSRVAEQPTGKATERRLRGAYGCELIGGTLHCFLWDPTKTTPLGTMSGPAGFQGWGKLAWKKPHDLDFEARWPQRKDPGP